MFLITGPNEIFSCLFYNETKAHSANLYTVNYPEELQISSPNIALSDLVGWLMQQSFRDTLCT